MAFTRLFDGYSKHTGRVLDGCWMVARDILDGYLMSRGRALERILEGYYTATRQVLEVY